MQFFSNIFKDNMAQVPAVIDDTHLKPFTEARRPGTIEQLKEAIRQEVAAIPPAKARKSMDSFRERLQVCVINNGRNLSHVIFKNVWKKLHHMCFL